MRLEDHARTVAVTDDARVAKDYNYNPVSNKTLDQSLKCQIDILYVMPHSPTPRLLLMHDGTCGVSSHRQDSALYLRDRGDMLQLVSRWKSLCS